MWLIFKGVMNMSLTAASLDSSSLSTLFSGMSASSGSKGASSNSIIADYYSIQNGSYYKMMKAYYNKVDTSDQSSSSSQKGDSVTALNKLQTSATSLKKTADALLTKGSDSVFNKVTSTDENGKTTTGYDTDKIYKAVNSFIDDYNAMITAGKKTSTTGVLTSVSGMTGSTAQNSILLGKLGITVGMDNKLSIDETAFKKADMSIAQSVFQSAGGYAYQISAKASMANYYAGNEFSTANSYTSVGKYTLSNAGNAYNNFI